LPIPGPGGEGIATLAQAAADDALLRHLDLSEQRKYPVTAADLASATVWIEASPAYLSRRMAILESALKSNERLVLSGQPTAWAEQVKGFSNVGQVALWPLPQQTLVDAAALPMPARTEAVKEFMAMITLPELWKARVLHWRKSFNEKDTNAVAYYYRAMPSEKDMDQIPAERPDLKEYTLRAKQNATYWLGLLQVDRGEPKSAVQYFQRLTLDQWPDGPWTSGARYNLARVYEATGEPAKAVALYATDVSPQFHGNRLRGKWLAEKQGNP
jgi:tetratricopeptide (TPR) repeat protein